MMDLVRLRRQVQLRHDDNGHGTFALPTGELLALLDGAEARQAVPIVCLCGSTRFMEAFFEAGWQFTLSDIIVLSVGVCKHAESHGAEAIGQDVADKLDELHKRKIDLAHAVFVLDVGNYIGASTRGEIEYATALGKPIAYLTTYHPPYECHDIDAVDWFAASAWVHAAALAALAALKEAP
ncbi:MAG TPA: hypothetical protein VMW48_01090 [Vicinamibacterales bacterium]|nr:hypothetical protein [Vicinamibacterales bacterium]